MSIHGIAISIFHTLPTFICTVSIYTGTNLNMVVLYQYDFVVCNLPLLVHAVFGVNGPENMLSQQKTKSSPSANPYP